MKLLVTGCGSIGRRHIKNLLSIGSIEVIAHDVTSAGRSAVEKAFRIKTIERYEDALYKGIDAVIIATPTNEHKQPAVKALQAGCHVFIEKPVAHDMEALNEILTIVRNTSLITMVGCNMRFHPGIKKVKELLDAKVVGRILSAHIETGSYMPEWRPGTDYRTIYSSRKDMGGGVILDAIHEIDYARWMLGEAAVVSCMADKQSSLEIDVEDVADILVRFTSGVIAQIHLDYVQRPYSRNCKFIGEHGIITWDFNKGRVGTYSATTKQWTWFTQPDNYDLNNMYIEEMKHFVNCIRVKEQTTLDILGGAEDLRIALAAKQSAIENRFISLQ